MPIHFVPFDTQVYYLNDTKYITVSKQIRFVIHMMEVIEMQGTMKIQDLWNSLKLSFKAIFPFGE